MYSSWRRRKLLVRKLKLAKNKIEKDLLFISSFSKLKVEQKGTYIGAFLDY